MNYTSKPQTRTNYLSTVFLLAFFISIVAPMKAQDEKLTSCKARNQGIAKTATELSKTATTTDKRREALTELKNLLSNADYIIACGIPEAGFAMIPAADFEKSAASLIEVAQVDKQVGANGGTSGSTSLISNGLAPSLLGFAFEAGGIERDIAGSVVTLRANPATLLQALAKKYGPGLEPTADPFLNALNRINFAATFDTKRSASTSAAAETPFRANYQQLTDFSVRVALFNGRDPYRRKNWLKFKALADAPQVQTVARLANDFLIPIILDPPFQLGLTSALVSLLDSKDDKVREAALAQYNELLRATVTRLNSSGAISAKGLKDFSEASSKMAESRRKLVDEIEHQALFNFEYALTRPPLVTTDMSNDPMPTPALFRPLATTPTTTTLGLNANPDISAARLVATWKLGTTDLSWNAAATFFNSLRPGMSGRFRDFNSGISAATPLGTLPNIGKITATVAARYMHLHQKPLGVDVLFNSTKVNKPGNIGWLQAKLTFPGPAKAIKIPLSFTYSNRTELIDEKDIRVNIGFSFDLDAVMRIIP